MSGPAPALEALTAVAGERRAGLRGRFDLGLRLPGQAISDTPPALNRLAWLSALRLLLPSLAAGVVVALGPGGPGDGLLVALAIYAASAAVLSVDLPLHLLQSSRFMLALLGPLLGCSAIAAAVGLGSGVRPSIVADLLLPAAVAFVAGVLLDWLRLRIVRSRPIRVAAIGSAVFAAGLSRETDEDRIPYVEMLGWLNIEGPGEEQGARRLGDRIEREVARHHIDLLVCGSEPGGGLGKGDLQERASEACLGLRTRLMSGNDFYEQAFGHVPLGTIDSAWYSSLVHPEFRPPPKLVRRVFDLVIALPVAIVALPLIAVAALAIKLEDRGPVFYRQTRVGERGEHFQILKLRTMRVDAERDGIQFSRAADSRVTRVGRVLRRTHVDELPQIINVLRGDMRFVGPRPERPEIVAEMERTFRQYSGRHTIKPGVTGWAQVRCGYAGSTLGTAWKLCHDLYYLKHRSFLSDLLIIAETLVIAAKDAHRPLRVPESQFVFAGSIGIDTEADEVGGLDERQLALAA